MPGCFNTGKKHAGSIVILMYTDWKPNQEAHTVISSLRRLTRYPAILSVLSLSLGFARAETNQVLKEGDRPPGFSVTTDRGKRMSSAHFGGSLLVLNFWETSCAPCLKELPSLSDFSRKFQSQQVVVLAVGGDADAKKYHRFLRDHRVVLETYRDPARRISKRFGTYLFPETYIIQDGRIVRKVVGAVDWMSDDIASFVGTRVGHQ